MATFAAHRGFCPALIHGRFGKQAFSKLPILGKYVVLNEIYRLMQKNFQYGHFCGPESTSKIEPQKAATVIFSVSFHQIDTKLGNFEDLTKG